VRLLALIASVHQTGKGMKTKKRKGRAAGPKKRSKDRRIVVLDQQPLRRKAASECRRAMVRLEKAKAEWNQFQQKDKAAFGRWVASTFGALLSRLREIEAAVEAKEVLVEEVEEEMFFGASNSPRVAYRKVQKRRSNSQPENDAQRAQSPPPRPGEDNRNWNPFDEDREFEEEMLFEEFVSVFMGIDPDRLSEKKYEKMFADFKANVLGQGSRRSKAKEPPPQPARKREPQQNRLKELYRQLVRRLHPDTTADNDPSASAIWHEVQEAYSAGNIERLEMLLAMTDLQANAIGEQTSVSQMQSVLSELRRSLNSLQRSLRAARKDPAWNFSALKDRSKLEKQVRNELETRLLWYEEALRELEEKIARWSAPPSPRKKPTARQNELRRQAEFPF
jgi:hypothetical protein